MKSTWIAILFLMVPALAFSQWTAPGTIESIQAGSNGVTIYTDLTANATDCQNKSVYYFFPSTDHGQFVVDNAVCARITAIAAMAKSNGSKVRLFVNGECNQWGQTKIYEIKTED